MRKCASSAPRQKPSTAPSAKPTAASLAVKSAEWKRIVISRGPTPPGRALDQRAWKMLCRCGIDVSSTTNGQVHASRIQSHR